MEWRCRNRSCSAVLGTVEDGMLRPSTLALIRVVKPKGRAVFGCRPCGRVKVWFSSPVDWEGAARFLFGLLDDIDTVSDMAKGDDVAYRDAVTRIQRRRFEIADADGQTVMFKGMAPADPPAGQDAEAR